MDSKKSRPRLRRMQDLQNIAGQTSQQIRLRPAEHHEQWFFVADLPSEACRCCWWL